MGLFPGVEREFHFEVDGHKFGGRFPLPSDRRNIDVIVSQRLGGTSLQSIPTETYSAEYVFVTLNYTLTDRPRDFEGLDFADIPDEDFIVKVWSQYNKLQKAYQAGLKKNNRTVVPTKTPGKQSRQSAQSVSTQRVPDIAERVPD
ncbi:MULTISPECIES: hypothetical protein [Leptospira]|uniref:Uncharacterized protein n=3 Tax=root TaxID=1 RepID=Q6NE11_9CAUD|nr:MULTISPECIES: hypothetical protein [Leptospira]YP_009860171.1 hypothetical protein HWD53_gp32 [Leptospira phage LE1]TGL75383.1 hypothetical protein EHQ60_00220 [Leptospira levettii]TGN13458.1 hypothetical protein EHR08_11390 [Leptospira bandrabouensis]CAE14709.1 unnamed protein product [Leptospira phage LE1]